MLEAASAELVSPSAWSAAPQNLQLSIRTLADYPIFVLQSLPRGDGSGDDEPRIRERFVPPAAKAVALHQAGGGHITFGGCLAQALTPFTPPLHELSPPFRNCNRSCVAARLAKSPHTWNWTRPTWRSRDRLEKP